jgi:hypothetical protein
MEELEGKLFPAIVVRCYTALERGHDSFGEKCEDENGYRQFSGIASINVILPSTFYFILEAQEDVNPEAVQGYGHGVTALPAPGKFTQASPAPLLT